MHDVRRSQEIILSHGGVHDWREKSRGSPESFRLFENTVKGGSKKSGRKGTIDIHGNDASYRSAKKRLHNLAIELGELSVLERAWELEQPPEPGFLAGTLKKDRMQYSATNAVALYNGAIQQGVFGKLEENCASYMRKRGREWEASVKQEYPESDTEDETMRHKWFKTNAAQRAFIDTSTGTGHEEGEEKNDTPPRPKCKRRRTDATVTLNEDAYVRKEADVDIFRYRVISLAMGSREDESTPPPRPSILRTTTLTIDPRPRHPHTRRATKKHDGALRAGCRWTRRYGNDMYTKGTWTVKEGSENVDTSGCRFGVRGHHAWEEYCAQLLEEEDRMDMEWRGLPDTKEDEADETGKFVDADEEDRVAEKDGAWIKVEEEQDEGWFGNECEEFRTEKDSRDETVDVDDRESHVAASTTLTMATVKVKGLARALRSFPLAWRCA